MAVAPAVAPAAAPAAAAPHPLPGNNNFNRNHLERNEYGIGGMPRNIYGVSDDALIEIVRAIKLGLLREMSMDVNQNNLPDNRNEFLDLISNKLDTVSDQMIALNATNVVQRGKHINLSINPDIISDNTDSAMAIKRRITNIREPIPMLEGAPRDITIRNLNELIDANSPIYDSNIYNPQDADNARTIQNSLNTIPIMESLYLRKHQELRQMFNFATLLYNKFNYTLRLSLHVVSLLSEHNSRDNTEQQKFNIPKSVIKDIRRLINEQQTMLSTINEARPAVDNIDVETIGREFTTEQPPPPPPAPTPASLQPRQNQPLLRLPQPPPPPFQQRQVPAPGVQNPNTSVAMASRNNMPSSTINTSQVDDNSLQFNRNIAPIVLLPQKTYTPIARSSVDDIQLNNPTNSTASSNNNLLTTTINAPPVNTVKVNIPPLLATSPVVDSLLQNSRRNNIQNVLIPGQTLNLDSSNLVNRGTREQTGINLSDQARSTASSYIPITVQDNSANSRRNAPLTEREKLPYSSIAVQDLSHTNNTFAVRPNPDTNVPVAEQPPFPDNSANSIRIAPSTTTINPQFVPLTESQELSLDSAKINNITNLQNAVTTNRTQPPAIPNDSQKSSGNSDASNLFNTLLMGDNPPPTVVNNGLSSTQDASVSKSVNPANKQHFLTTTKNPSANPVPNKKKSSQVSPVASKTAIKQKNTAKKAINPNVTSRWVTHQKVWPTTGRLPAGRTTETTNKTKKNNIKPRPFLIGVPQTTGAAPQYQRGDTTPYVTPKPKIQYKSSILLADRNKQQQPPPLPPPPLPPAGKATAITTNKPKKQMSFITPSKTNVVIPTPRGRRREMIFDPGSKQRQGASGLVSLRPRRGGGRKSPMNRTILRDKDNQNIHHKDEYEDDYEDNH